MDKVQLVHFNSVQIVKIYTIRMKLKHRDWCEACCFGMAFYVSNKVILNQVYVSNKVIILNQVYVYHIKSSLRHSCSNLHDIMV